MSVLGLYSVVFHEAAHEKTTKRVQDGDRLQKELCVVLNAMLPFLLSVLTTVRLMFYKINRSPCNS
jgi:hypothetical protein